MLSNSRVRSNAVLVHDGNQFSFSQQLGRRRLTIAHVASRRLERLSQLEIRYDITSPLLVRIHVQVVEFQYLKSRGVKVLLGNANAASRQVAQRVFGTARQKPTRDKLVHSSRVTVQAVGNLDRMYGRMRLVIVLALARPTKLATLL